MVIGYFKCASVLTILRVILHTLYMYIHILIWLWWWQQTEWKSKRSLFSNEIQGHSAIPGRGSSTCIQSEIQIQNTGKKIKSRNGSKYWQSVNQIKQNKTPSWMKAKGI